jgi:hypothetical protein
MTVIIALFNSWKKNRIDYVSGIFIIEAAYVCHLRMTVCVFQNQGNPFLVWKPEGKKPLGRRWCRWEDIYKHGILKK